MLTLPTGWYGLAAAKQYHCTQPERSLAILESAEFLGGTWAEHRLYPGLKSNNLLGTYEYPDFPMDTETFGVKTNEHIPGTVVNTYLKAYASKFGIDSKIRYRTNVIVAEHQENTEGGWILTIAGPDETEYQIYTRDWTHLESFPAAFRRPGDVWRQAVSQQALPREPRHIGNSQVCGDLWRVQVCLGCCPCICHGRCQSTLDHSGYVVSSQRPLRRIKKHY
jgi:hypothetical protein